MTRTNRLSTRRPRDPRYSAGFTLVELATSMAIMSVLIGAMGSAVFLATKALPDPDSPTFIILDTGKVADDIAQELRYAVTFTQRLANLVEFTVGDRDNDLAAETILYQWSGTPGDPLTRQYNGGTIVNLIDSVEQFTLTYTVRTVVDTTAQRPNIEGTEQQFLVQDDGNSGTEAQFSLSGDYQRAQYFQPTLPADTVNWRVTRLKFIGEPQSPTSGAILVGVRSVMGNGDPSAVELDAVTVNESDLVATQWREVTFANADGLDPATGCFIAFARSSGSGVVGKITQGNNSTASPATKYYSFDGVSWVEDTAKDIWMWVWGTSSTPDLSWVPPTIDYLKTMTITVQSGTDPATAVELETAVLNQPVVP